MLKTLIKKELMEKFKSILIKEKSGERRKLTGVIGFVLLYLFVFFSFSVNFFMMAFLMAEPYYDLNLSWLYFATLSLISILISVFMNMFIASSLYNSKDDELLLSLPIKPIDILISRIVPLFILCLLFAGVVFIPAMIVYIIMMFNKGELNVLMILLELLLYILNGIIALMLSIIAGFYIAKVNKKFKNKQYITVIFSLCFIGVYYYFYYGLMNKIQNEIPLFIAGYKKLKTFMYPFYTLGRMAEGDLLSGIISAIVVLGIFYLVLKFLASNFLNITKKDGEKIKKDYEIKNKERKSIKNALLFKEFKRFTSSSTYMLNCGLGMVIIPVMAIFLCLKKDVLNQLINEVSLFKDYLPLFACAFLCFTSVMVDVAAPSISLEGKNLWILRSLPVETKDILKAKLRLQLKCLFIPLIFAGILMVINLKFDILEAILTINLSLIFGLLVSILSLICNLLFPNLNWVNETAPIKQDMNMLIYIFGSFLILILTGGIFYLTRNIINLNLYLLLVTAFFIILIIISYNWLLDKGVKRFEEL